MYKLRVSMNAVAS